MKRILIADDQQDIATMLANYCHAEGYSTYIAQDGQQALDLFESYNPDLILLDVMMPKLDGYTVCSKIRKVSTVPILMVTARSEDADKILGLDIGADDYIVKPFSMKEVMARIRSIFRRIDATQTRPIVISELTVDPSDMSVSIFHQKIDVTKKEYDLMYQLASYPNHVFTRAALIEACWSMDYQGEDRTVDAHIKRLRSKLDQIDHPSFEIKTIWGVGYKLEVIYEEGKYNHPI